jgi:hypothetical protein
MVVRLVVVRWCGGVVVVEEELIFLNQVAGYVVRSQMCFFLLEGRGIVVLRPNKDGLLLVSDGRTRRWCWFGFV